MKEVKDFKTRYNNLAHEVKILTSHKKVSDAKRRRYFLELSNLYIITYSYLDEITLSQEHKKYLKRMYILRDEITKFGLNLER